MNSRKHLSLAIALCALTAAAFWGPGHSAAAQEPPPAPVPQPAPVLSQEPAPIVVLELYSSQACVFCPAADRFFGDLVQTTSLIGLACHVDYFDVRQGSLARHFCSERQSDYMTRLRAGPNYTPQMVVNGHIDVVGYRHDKVSEALKEAALDGVEQVDIAPAADKGSYTLALPEAAAGEYTLWLMVYDRPHDVKIAEGNNRGALVTYVNVVSDLKALDPWDGTAQVRTVPTDLTDANAGFVVLAQDAKTGRVVAAGRFASSPPQ